MEGCEMLGMQPRSPVRAVSDLGPLNHLSNLVFLKRSLIGLKLNKQARQTSTPGTCLSLPPQC